MVSSIYLGPQNGTPESPPTDSAAKIAGMELGSSALDVALRYLLDQSYSKQSEVGATYTITVGCGGTAGNCARFRHRRVWQVPPWTDSRRDVGQSL